MAHDAALLLDRLLSLGGNAAHLTEGRLPLAAAACLHLALCQDPGQAGRALPALSRLADQAGAPFPHPDFLSACPQRVHGGCEAAA